MSKTKVDKKKPEAADPQVMGPKRKRQPRRFSAPDTEKAGTGADQSQDSGSEAEVPQSGEIESGDKSLTVVDAEKPENGSGEAQDGKGEGEVAQTGEAESGGAEPTGSDADDGSGSTQDPQRKAKVSPFGDAASEGEQQAAGRRQPQDDSKPAHTPVVLESWRDC